MWVIRSYILPELAIRQCLDPVHLDFIPTRNYLVWSSNVVLNSPNQWIVILFYSPNVQLFSSNFELENNTWLSSLFPTSFRYLFMVFNPANLGCLQIWFSFYALTLFLPKVSSVQVSPLQRYSIPFSSRSYLSCLPKSCDPLSFSTTVIPTMFLTSTYLPACLFLFKQIKVFFSTGEDRPRKAALAPKTIDILKKS